MNQTYDIIIVGAGPAGLTSAIYGLRAGKSVLLLEAVAYGGQIINTPDIENYPAIKSISGFDFATNLYEQAMGFGAEIKYERVTEIVNEKTVKIVKTTKNEYVGRTVILATGAKNRPLGVERETEYVGRGVSYCATCDGAFYKGKIVAVVGGGNTALEDALYLSNYCTKVYLIHRRDQFRGDKKDVEKISSRENVEFVLNSRVTKLEGTPKLSKIEVENILDGSKKELEVAGLFIAVGQMPENAPFADVVSLDAGGYVSADESCRTTSEGIFVAGDCRTKIVRQLATAVGDGAVAALAACGMLD